jgi:hypothetical protein
VWAFGWTGGKSLVGQSYADAKEKAAEQKAGRAARREAKRAQRGDGKRRWGRGTEEEQTRDG